LKDIQRESYQIVAPRLVSSITFRFPPDSALYTDGSSCEGTTGFGVYHSENFEISLRLVEPSGVFTSELTAILYALVHIKTHSSGRYSILTDSLSSVYALESRIILPKVHELVYQCKEAFWQLNEIGYEISIAWIPSHIGIGGNERVDRLAKCYRSCFGVCSIGEISYAGGVAGKVESK
jgi:ribonuclease HI